MKKVLVIVLALVMCLSAFAVASAEEVKGDINGDGTLKIGFS